MIESRALTGEDLGLADVWAVAVDHAPVAIADSAVERMAAARVLVEQALHGSREHTYGVNT
ncbi:MAG: aromatic amino acid lyase, partial [Gaiellaceae bacterium]